MRIAAYQFAGCGDIDTNFRNIQKGIREAAKCGARICVFHECALTGYPPLECKADEIDFAGAGARCAQVKKMAEKHGLFVFLGTAVRNGASIHNAVRVFAPSGTELQPYYKRALWGWDREKFSEGNERGIYEIDDIKVGVRICFEIRFPEYFRELYHHRADLGIVCFCDNKNQENTERYDTIKGHLQTRAVENALPILSVNNARKYQTAPTAFFDHHGRMAEAVPGDSAGLLVYDFEKYEDDFGTAGIKHINGRVLSYENFPI